MVVPLDNVLSARQKEAFKEEERFGSQSDKVHTYGQREFYSKLRSQKFCLPCLIMILRNQMKMPRNQEKLKFFDMSKNRPFWAAELDFKSRETFVKNSMSHCGEKIGYFL